MASEKYIRKRPGRIRRWTWHRCFALTLPSTMFTLTNKNPLKRDNNWPIFTRHTHTYTRTYTRTCPWSNTLSHKCFVVRISFIPTHLHKNVHGEIEPYTYRDSIERPLLPMQDLDSHRVSNRGDLVPNIVELNKHLSILLASSLISSTHLQLIDWFIDFLTACQPVSVYFMPIRKKIAFILQLYLQFLRWCFCWLTVISNTIGLVWFGCILFHIKPYGLFNVKSSSCIYVCVCVCVCVLKK